MNEEPTEDQLSTETFVLPEGFTLPEGVTELPVFYEGLAVPKDLPDVALTDVFRHSERVVWHGVQAEVVLYVLDTDVSYVLNPMAALAWQCLDGVSAVGDILADIADVYSVPVAQVEHDFIPNVAEWLHDLLIEEVNHD